MKKVVLFLFIFLLVAPLMLALDLEVEKTSANEVLILGLNQPAVFDIRVTNLGSSENVNLYSFFGQDFYPKGQIYLQSKKPQDITIQIYPPEKIKPGYYTFDYYIRNNNADEVAEQLTLDIINFEDAFEIGAEDFDPGRLVQNVG